MMLPSSLLVLVAAVDFASSNRHFTISYKNNTFVKDGKPFRYISGSVHYMRVHPGLWLDRLMKIREAGFNAIQFYVEWNHHEPLPGRFDFSGRKDVFALLDLAHKLGLLAIVRAGPYICGERDGGGLPFWLKRLHPDIRLRTSDGNFLSRVDLWWEQLLPRLKPYLYSNGGPVIMVQLENEYGSFGSDEGVCDVAYLQHLRDKLRQHLGNEVILYTTDGVSESLLRCGKTEGVYATVDFGPGTDPKEAFHLQRIVEPRGPLVNSEFYPGWFDNWGLPHHTEDAKWTAAALDDILAAGANVNVYMAHGGTNFGFENGAGAGPPYTPVTTSYDYDAPISEAGVKTEKFYAFQKIISKHLQTKSSDYKSPDPSFANYGKVKLSYASSFLAARGSEIVKPAWKTEMATPPTFKDLWQASGFVLYETKLKEVFSQPAMLKADSLHDRGYVFLDGKPQGILGRGESCTGMPLMANKGDTLQILVEDQGRVGYGEGQADLKGLIAPVSLGKTILEGWTAYSMPLDDPKALSRYVHNVTTGQKTSAADTSTLQDDLHRTRGHSAFWWGEFKLPCQVKEPEDTFLRLDGWKKGVAFVNGFNLGRYWPEVGPQVTLYVPRTVLFGECKINEVILFEQERPDCLNFHLQKYSRHGCQVELVADHVINGTTPEGSSIKLRDIRGRWL